MAIARPRTIDDASGTDRSIVKDAGAETFLVREEWAVSAQGKKVGSSGVAAEAIEAQPILGQIKPREARGPWAETAAEGEARPARISAERRSSTILWRQSDYGSGHLTATRIAAVPAAPDARCESSSVALRIGAA
jgi:hypothetical protein